MKKLLPAFLITLISGYGMMAQPTILWQKSLGGSNIDKSATHQHTFDDGFIVGGGTASSDGDVVGNQGDFDSWIVKLNNTGAIQWQKSLGGTSYDYCRSIQQTSDSGYVLVSLTSSTDGNVTGNQGSYDYWVVKLDNAGDLLWQKCLGGSGSDLPNAIRQTPDGGYIVAGSSTSDDGDVTGNHGNNDCWVVKLNATADIEWQLSLGGNDYDVANAVQPTPEGGYIIGGGTRSTDGDVTGNHGDIDYWIVKISGAGAIQWQKCLGGSGSDNVNAIYVATDGGFLVSGSSSSLDGDITGNHGNNDFWIVKLSSTGSLEWQKCLGGSDFDEATSIQQASDGGIVIAGAARSSDGDVTGHHGDDDYWVVKLSSDGILEWQKTVGGLGNDFAASIQQSADGGFLVTGHSDSNDGDVTGNHGESDYWIVKLSSGIGIEEFNNPFYDLQITNDANSGVADISFTLSQTESLTVVIYGVDGKKVTDLFNGTMNPGRHHIPCSLNAVTGGIYFVNFRGKMFNHSGKLVIL